MPVPNGTELCLPTTISKLLNESHTKKDEFLMKNVWEFSGKKGEQTINRKMTRQKEQEDNAEKTREETGKGKQRKALRFQTGW